MIPIGHRHRGGAAEPDSPPIPGVVLKKGPWSAAEDKILIEYVREHGEGNWNAVQRNTALQRCGKSCRLRWANHLRPNLKKGAFSSEEERLIIDLHSKLGNKWARISAQLPGRTDNEVKNYWNTRVKRRVRQGLPLYPHNRQSLSTLPPPPLPPQQPTSPPPAPPLPVSLSHLKTPFLDPTSLPFPAPFFSFNNPSFLSNPPPGFLIQPCFSNLGFNSQHPIQTHVELQQPNPLELEFDYKLELPSNQFCPNLAGDDDEDEDVDDCEADDGMKFYPNVSERRSNSGLLDALLEEAQSRAATARNLKKDCLDGDQWDSIFGNSSSGEGEGEGEDKGDAKMDEQDEHTYYTNDDLSSILNLIPSLVTAPKYKEGHQESSSNVSDENARHISSNTEWFSTSTSYTSWDNLPRIC